MPAIAPDAALIYVYGSEPRAKADKALPLPAPLMFRLCISSVKWKKGENGKR